MRLTPHWIAAGLLLFTSAAGQPSALFAAVEMPAASYLKGLTWLGHASFRLARGGVVVYFDPYQVQGEPHDADLVLISHPHFDHLDPASLAKIAKPETVIVTVEEAVAKLEEVLVPGTIKTVKPGDAVEAAGAKIQAVPAYNSAKEFHKKESGWVGFVVELDGVRFYYAGDTDAIPEMAGLQPDVALLPVSGTYVMTAEEAAEAAKTIGARMTVPMHYGSVVGTAADAERFQKLCGSLIVEVMEKGTEK